MARSSLAGLIHDGLLRPDGTVGTAPRPEPSPPRRLDPPGWAKNPEHKARIKAHAERVRKDMARIARELRKARRVRK